MKNKQVKDNRLLLIPLLFIIGIVPLIVYLRAQPLSGIVSKLWIDSKFDTDFFSYYKAIWLMVGTGALALVMIGMKLDDTLKLKKTSMYIPLGIYAFFVLLSTLLAEHKDVAVWGFASRYEGMLVLLCYCFIVFGMINLVDNEKDVKAIINTFIASAVLIGIIGAFQFFGFDWFKSEIGKKLMLPAQYRTLDVNFTFGKYTIYATMFNTNNVGSYAAMMVPLSLIIFAHTRSMLSKVSSGLFSLLMFVLLVGCRSRAGIIGAVVSLLIAIAIIRRSILREWIKFSCFAAGCIIMLIIMNSVSGGVIYSTGKSIAEDINKSVGETRNTAPIRDIVLENGDAKVVTDAGSLKISLKDSKLSFLNENNEQMAFAQTKENDKIVYSFQDEKYSDFKFTYIAEAYMLQMNKGGTIVRFGLTEKGIVFINKDGAFVAPTEIRKIDIKGKEAVASGRLFIWSRSIPLLLDTLFIGKGPDTYAIYFPQNDFVGKILGLGNQNILVDKPHNIYLQMGINTGVISLLAFLVLIGMYFVSCFKLYFRKDTQEGLLNTIGSAAFAGVAGYLAAGVFNDSIVSVAPLFWALLGLGIAINMKLSKAK
ncbi:MAG: O-antigen ligase family protein [Clostridia bacterium]|nr:O-antigen ligase family protein [Clostridia bacterium]